MSKKRKDKAAKVVPLFGRDEMNLIEIPFGPITPGSAKTLTVNHEAFDKKTKRRVNRQLVMTGSDTHGLPRPIDDKVLMGLMAVTAETNFLSRTIQFSGYQLFNQIGWSGGGRSYLRLEASLDRIHGTNLKFKDSWWDKGEQEWKSHAFHLIDNYELCTRNRLEGSRIAGKGSKLCSVTWNEVIWKSFTDGHIRRMDMKMFRRVSSGRSKEVAVRLFRVLEKRFYFGPTCRFSLERLCKGIVGMSQSYSPSQMVRGIERASWWLIECGALSAFQILPNRKTRELEVVFRRYARPEHKPIESKQSESAEAPSESVRKQFGELSPESQQRLLKHALSHCDNHKPFVANGYRSSKNGSIVRQRYLEMVLIEYVLARKNSRVA